MSRLTQSDEMHILNELNYIEERLYKGITEANDLKYAVRTIRNLLLELYLMKRDMTPEQKEELELHIKNSVLASNAAIKEHEANKAF